MACDRMTSLGHVAAGIAHEIRNPLSGITIDLHALEKILAKGKDLAEALSVIEKIKTSSLRIDAVIKRVMDFSKPGEPKLALIDIRVPIEDALSLSSASFARRTSPWRKIFRQSSRSVLPTPAHRAGHAQLSPTQLRP